MNIKRRLRNLKEKINPRFNATIISELSTQYRKMQSSIIKYLGENYVEESDLSFINETMKKAGESIIWELKNRKSSGT